MSDSVRVVEVAGVPIGFVASDSARASSVAAAVGLLPPHRGPAALNVIFGPQPVALANRPWDHADGEVRAWWEGEDLLLAHSGFSCRVGSASAVIGGEGDVVRAFRQLLPYVLAHLLTRHDRFVLHAGAIARSDRAVLVLGASGSGKSTLVVGALRSGWSALADDLIVIRNPASPEACGVAKQIVAPAAVVEPSGLSDGPLTGDPRGRWLVAGELESGWFPVVGTIVSIGEAAAEPSLQPLSSTRLVKYLLSSFLSARRPDLLRQFLPVAAAITCRGGWGFSHSGGSVDDRERISQLLERLAVPAGRRSSDRAR